MKNNYQRPIHEELELTIESGEIDEIRKEIQFNLNAKQQKRLIDELLKSLPEPTNIIDDYAELKADQARLKVKDVGNLLASKSDIWEMARKDNGGGIR